MVESHAGEPADADNLEAFVDAEELDASAGQANLLSVQRDLLIFEFGRDRFAVEARRVESVVPWKAPARIPGTDTRVHGVIQDRGRIVVVMAHPAGITAGPNPPAPKRIVVCNSARGHIGLPATSARAVGGFALASEPTPLSVHDSALGAFTYLEPFDYGPNQ
jgi:chemotaxis signal transduction protein